MVIDLDILVGGGPGKLLGGPVIDGTVQRLCCDASVHRVVCAGRPSILDYGTTTGTVPAPLWSALVVRDQHCRFPGCDRPSAWGETHHVVNWPHSGATSPENPCCCAYGTIISVTDQAGEPDSTPPPSWRSPFPTGEHCAAGPRRRPGSKPRLVAA